MVYWKRLVMAWFGAFITFTLHTIAVNGFGFTWTELGLVLAVIAGIALVTGAIAAAVIRKRPVAMVLLSQVLIIVVMGAVWNR